MVVGISNHLPPPYCTHFLTDFFGFWFCGLYIYNVLCWWKESMDLQTMLIYLFLIYLLLAWFICLL